MSSSPSSVVFYAFGDWGDDTPDKKKTMATMTRYARKHPPNFIVPLGDNFYPSGVRSVRDPQWRETYLADSNSKELQCPWFAILGNHDYLGDPEAQIAFRDHRWRMFSRYFFFERNGLFVLNIDTVGLALFETSQFISASEMEKKGLNQEYKNKQLAWIDHVLGASRAQWKVVCGHYPMYSQGEHGNTMELIECLEPLLRKHGVSVYLSGHDHSFQHVEKNGIHYVVTGCFAKRGSLNGFRFRGSLIEPGFTCVRIHGNQLTMSYVTEGRELRFCAI